MFVCMKSGSLFVRLRVFVLMCLLIDDLLEATPGYIGGWGSESNREIVSVRSHARTRGLVVRSDLGKKKLGSGPCLFPLGAGG